MNKKLIILLFILFSTYNVNAQSRYLLYGTTEYNIDGTKTKCDTNLLTPIQYCSCRNIENINIRKQYNPIVFNTAGFELQEFYRKHNIGLILSITSIALLPISNNMYIKNQNPLGYYICSGIGLIGFKFTISSYKHIRNAGILLDK